MGGGEAVGSSRHVVLSSIFRDSAEYVRRYFDQVNDLAWELSGKAFSSLVIAEGDSTDDTYEAIREHLRIDDVLLQVNHGGRKFGSVDHPERWANIAKVCNTVADHWPEGATVIYVESDLIWEPETMLRLLEDLDTVPAVAPMCMKDGRFYDLWGHRGLDGERFTMGPPYHKDLEATDDALVEIGSAGSCVVMRPEIARVARFGENDCMVGLGRSIRFEAGGHLYLDRTVAVHHP